MTETIQRRPTTEYQPWMCSRNLHDRNVTGTYEHNRCRMCHLERSRDRRKVNSALRSGDYNGHRQPMPNLLAIRKRFGLSQRELSELSGVSRSLISYAERGYRNPGYASQVKLIGAIAKLQGVERKKRELYLP